MAPSKQSNKRRYESSSESDSDSSDDEYYNKLDSMADALPYDLHNYGYDRLINYDPYVLRTLLEDRKLSIKGSTKQLVDRLLRWKDDYAAEQASSSEDESDAESDDQSDAESDAESESDDQSDDESDDESDDDNSSKRRRVSEANFYLQYTIKVNVPTTLPKLPKGWEVTGNGQDRSHKDIFFTGPKKSLMQVKKKLTQWARLNHLKFKFVLD